MIYYRKTLFGRGPKLTAVQATIVANKATLVQYLGYVDTLIRTFH